ALFIRGTANGLGGLRWLTPEQLHEIEPHAAGVAAVHVPQEGIADYPAVCRALSSEIQARGGEVITGAEVRAILRESSTWRVVTSAGDYQADRIVTCAGLYADRVAAMTGKARDVRIVPFRGEYYGIRPERQYLVRNLIYPVPDPAFPFLGVHYTRMIHGGVEAGPNAVIALKREGYTKTDLSLKDAWEGLTFPGLYRFVSRHRAAAVDEIRTTMSRGFFLRKLQRLV